MECCLMCLEMKQEFMYIIKVDSLQWQELNIKYLIDKYLWSMQTIQNTSWLCNTCWHMLYEFHKFYMRIAEVQYHFNSMPRMDIPKEPHFVDAGNSMKESLPTDYLIKEHVIFKPIQEESNEHLMVADIKEEQIEQSWLADNIVPINEVKDERPWGITDDGTGLATNKVEIMTEEEATFCENKKYKQNNSISSAAPMGTNDNLVTNYMTSSGSSLDNKQPIAQLQIKHDPDSIETYQEYIWLGNTLKNYKNEQPSMKESIQIFGNIASNTFSNLSINDIDEDKIIAENSKIICTLCNIPMLSFQVLLNHFKDEHKQPGYVICCNKKFFKRNVLVDHILIHLDQYFFQCKQCGKLLTDRPSLMLHSTIHETKEEKNYCCDLCGRCFATAEKLSTHRSTHYRKKKN